MNQHNYAEETQEAVDVETESKAFSMHRKDPGRRVFRECLDKIRWQCGQLHMFVGKSSSGCGGQAVVVCRQGSGHGKRALP